MQNLTVVTTGLYAALELSFAPDVTTIVVGGVSAAAPAAWMER